MKGFISSLAIIGLLLPSTVFGIYIPTPTMPEPVELQPIETTDLQVVPSFTATTIPDLESPVLEIAQYSCSFSSEVILVPENSTNDIKFYVTVTSATDVDDVPMMWHPTLGGTGDVFAGERDRNLNVAAGTHTQYLGHLLVTDTYSTIVVTGNVDGYECDPVTAVVVENVDPYDAFIDALMGGSADSLVPVTPEIPDWVGGSDIPDFVAPEDGSGEDDDPIGEGILPAEEDGGPVAPEAEGDIIPGEEAGMEGAAPGGLVAPEAEGDDIPVVEGEEGVAGVPAEVGVEDEIELTPELVEEILASPEAEGVDLTDRVEVESLVESYIEKLKEERALARVEAEKKAIEESAMAAQVETDSETPVWVYVLYGILPVLLIVLAVVILMKKPEVPTPISSEQKDISKE